MSLLQKKPDAAPPLDSLLVRVRCRRAQLDLSGANDPWPGQTSENGLQGALQWLFKRLPPPAFKRLRPYLELLAGKTLVQALRLYRAGRREAMARLLQRSLLHPELAERMLAANGNQALISLLERELKADYPQLAGLTAAYADQGPGGAEEWIAAGLLRHALARARDPALTFLLQRLTDLRNILVLAKYWRWQVTLAPPLLAGGTVSPVRLQRLWAARDEDGLGRLVVRLAGASQAPPQDARAMETLLLKGITAELRRLGRDPLGNAVLLDYLWRCQMAARNRALLAGLDDDSEALLDESMVLA